MREGEYLDSLISEYENLLVGEGLAKDPQSEHDEADIIEDLIASADWSDSGAYELMQMVHTYGAFMLRNALAVAVVLGKEDGEQGF